MCVCVCVFGECVCLVSVWCVCVCVFGECVCVFGECVVCVPPGAVSQRPVTAGEDHPAASEGAGQGPALLHTAQGARGTAQHTVRWSHPLWPREAGWGDLLSITTAISILLCFFFNSYFYYFYFYYYYYYYSTCFFSFSPLPYPSSSTC